MYNVVKWRGAENHLCSRPSSFSILIQIADGLQCLRHVNFPLGILIVLPPAPPAPLGFLSKLDEGFPVGPPPLLEHLCHM